MAKLSARGRTELVRLTHELTRTLEQDPVCDWKRYTVAIMSDRKVLRKMDVRFRSDGRKHSYGWTYFATLKDGLAIDTVVQQYLASGYTREI